MVPPIPAFEDDPRRRTLETRVLDWLYGTWLPESGYVPDDQPAFEAWVGRPFAHGFEHFEVDVHLPVRPG